MTRGRREERYRPRTLYEAAVFVGAEPGTTTGVYTPTTCWEPHERLRIEPGAEAALAAGTRWARGPWPSSPPTRRPSSGRSTSTSGSASTASTTASPPVTRTFPGDADLPEPYAYAGPWEPVADPDGFFDTPFGAARTARRLCSTAEVVAFFRTARDHARRTS